MKLKHELCTNYSIPYRGWLLIVYNIFLLLSNKTLQRKVGIPSIMGYFSSVTTGISAWDEVDIFIIYFKFSKILIPDLVFFRTNLEANRQFTSLIASFSHWVSNFVNLPILPTFWTRCRRQNKPSRWLSFVSTMGNLSAQYGLARCRTSQFESNIADKKMIRPFLCRGHRKVVYKRLASWRLTKQLTWVVYFAVINESNRTYPQLLLYCTGFED